MIGKLESFVIGMDIFENVRLKVLEPIILQRKPARSVERNQARRIATGCAVERTALNRRIAISDEDQPLTLAAREIAISDDRTGSVDGKLITAVGDMINFDPDVNRFMKVAFVPNFNVQNAHLIYPAANLSEQISTAGKEASGTGNMKFMLNGALTIGTLDGANVEIREEAGPENFFLFGLTESEVEQVKRDGYRPSDYVDGNDELQAVLGLISSGQFSHGDTEVFRPLVDNLIHDDPFLVMADYASYVECQDRVAAAWQDPDAWSRMSILNTARSGKFSSDRAIREYCDDIWNVGPVTVKVEH